ncbi:SurA N-terminal domain-containing protein [Caldalkalibacillus salinus]|uniref:SurA N-terminal domain-containing protein n=1 Tax=Caldalkalibacillus salinus TaxID=2803787 RepID=UPI001921BE17|nr:SurA N-terminal domain-containing protein [Caldalkalibacillus salinus]
MKLNGKRLATALILALALVVTACGQQSDGSDGDAVAIVNGEEIPRETYDSQIDMVLDNYAQQGMDVESEEGQQMVEQIEQSVLESLITQELLLQKASEYDLHATEDEVEAELQTAIEQFGSQEKFEEALAQHNYTEEDLREELETNLTIEKLREQELDEVDVTEEELQDMYDQYSSAQEDFPPYEEVKADLEQLVQEEKQQEQFQQYVDELKEESDIERLV